MKNQLLCVIEVYFESLTDSSLLFLNTEHWSARKLSKDLAFFKSIINLSWCNKGGVQGFFYYSKGSLILTSKIFDWSEDETNEFSK